jgi:hypothetical protein
MSTDQRAPEPCTNWYGTRKHYSTDLTEDRSIAPSRHGRSLCWNQNNPVAVYDQAAMDNVAQTYQSKRVVVDDLPECKKCAQIVAKLEQANA